MVTSGQDLQLGESFEGETEPVASTLVFFLNPLPVTPNPLCLYARAPHHKPLRR
jgi:hypothetical protein